MKEFTLMMNERIIWKGRQSLWGSGAVVLILVGVFFMLVSVSLLREALALTLFGLFLVIYGGYFFKKFKTYIITNKRLVELKAGKIVKEVNLDEIAKTYNFSAIGNILDFAAMLLTGAPVKGLMPLIFGIDNLYVKDAEGRTVFVFRRIRVKKVREKMIEALKELFQ